MSIKVYFALCFATVCSAAFGQGENDLEKKMVSAAKPVCKRNLINRMELVLSLEGIFTSCHLAACLRREPPPGRAMYALCQENALPSKVG